MDTTQIMGQLLGQIVRHFLMLAAGFLGTIGVERATMDGAVGAAVPLIVSFILAIIVTLWGYFQKEFQARFLEAVFHANPSKVTLEEVRQSVIDRHSPPDTPI